MNIEEVYKLSRAVMNSGLAPRELHNADAVFAVMMAGRELGISPMESLRALPVVKGKISMSSQLMLSFVKRAGIKHTWLEDSDKAARLLLERDGEKPYENAFTISDARTAGLAGSNTYKNPPRSMLRARCVSNAIRAYCPDVVTGFYTPEELEHIDEAPARQEKPSEPEEKKMTLDEFTEWLDGEGLTIDQLDAYMAIVGGKKRIADMQDILDKVKARLMLDDGAALGAARDLATQGKADEEDAELTDDERPF